MKTNQLTFFYTKKSFLFALKPHKNSDSDALEANDSEAESDVAHIDQIGNKDLEHAGDNHYNPS